MSRIESGFGFLQCSRQRGGYSGLRLKLQCYNSTSSGTVSENTFKRKRHLEATSHCRQKRYR
jgi:hypothetical protein